MGSRSCSCRASWKKSSLAARAESIESRGRGGAGSEGEGDALALLLLVDVIVAQDDGLPPGDGGAGGSSETRMDGTLQSVTLWLSLDGSREPGAS